MILIDYDNEWFVCKIAKDAEYQQLDQDHALDMIYDDDAEVAKDAKGISMIFLCFNLVCRHIGFWAVHLIS